MIHISGFKAAKFITSFDPPFFLWFIYPPFPCLVRLPEAFANFYPQAELDVDQSSKYTQLKP